MLSERKHTILQSLIQEYVISAHPVASSTLARYYVPRLSSATVRNELSWLEDRGYVAQPHTSAGRLPTIAGYRTFVNSLLLQPQHYSTIVRRHSVHGATDTRFAQISSDYKSVSLPVMATLAAAADKLAHVHEALGSLAEHNKSLMVFWAPQLSTAVIHRGLPLLLSQPEFAESSAALPIMQLLESHGDLMTIFNEVMLTGGLHIKIGSENKDSQLYEFSLVAMRFDCAHLGGAFASNKVSAAGESNSFGVVALFGPTRMDYGWAISSITSLVQDLENPSPQQRG